MFYNLSDDATKKVEKLIDEVKEKSFIKSALSLIVTATLPIWGVVALLAIYLLSLWILITKTKTVYEEIKYHLWDKKKYREALQIVSKDLYGALLGSPVPQQPQQTHNEFVAPTNKDKLLH